MELHSCETTLVNQSATLLFESVMAQRHSSPSQVPDSFSPKPQGPRQPLENKNKTLFFPHGTERSFRLAANEMFYLPHHIGYRIPEEEKLNFYKYYKQATVGDLNIRKPDIFETVGNRKWWAWESLKGMPKEEAMRHYLHLTAPYREQGRIFYQQQQQTKKQQT